MIGYDARPYPWDSLMKNRGFMLVKGQQNESSWRRDVQLPGGRGREKLTYNGWPGGFGLRRHNGSEQSLQTIFSTEPAKTALGVPIYGTGVDNSFGGAMLSAELVDATIDAGVTKYVRSVVPFRSKYYAAVGTKIYVSVTGLWNDTSLAQACTGQVRRLWRYRGSNSPDLLYVAQDDAPYLTFDGSSWQTDAQSPKREAPAGPTGWFSTSNDGASYSDGTLAVSDRSGSTTAPLGGMHGIAQGDWTLIGFPVKFSETELDLSTFNTVNSVAVVQYYDPVGFPLAPWQSVTGLLDDTSAGGKTMSKDGIISWNFPPGWRKATLGGTNQTAEMYFIRLSFTNALSASVNVRAAKIRYQCEAHDFGLTGKYLWRLHSVNQVAWTEDGGRKAQWNGDLGGFDPVGSSDAEPIALIGIQGAMFVRKTDGLFGINPDGTNTQYDPGGLYETPISGSDGHVHCAWLNHVYFSHQNALWQFSPLEDGAANPVGPDRVMVNESEIQVTPTAGVGDRGSFLYLAGRNSQSGLSYLLKWGSYQQVVSPATGTIRWERTDGWHITHHLGPRTIVSLHTYWIADQPYLVLGDTAGVLSYLRLPRGTSPLDANSGSRFCVGGSMLLPAFEGLDPAQEISASRATINGRFLTAARTVTVSTKSMIDTAWTEQGVADAPGSDDVAFDAPYSGFALDQKLTLATDSNLATPFVERYTLDWQHVGGDRESFVIEAAIQCADAVIDNAGMVHDDTTADEWADAAIALYTETEPFDIVGPDGQERQALVRSWADTGYVWKDRYTRTRTITLVLSGET